MSSTRSFGMIAFGSLAVLMLLALHPLRCVAQVPAEATAINDDSGQGPLGGRFQKYDSNKDGYLSESEYLTVGGQDIRALRRDFKVFDFDHDSRMSYIEFLALPSEAPEDQRGAVPDPIVLLVEQAFKTITRNWQDIDQNADGSLDLNEFKQSEIGKRVRGLETTTFDDWDLNGDGKLSQQESRQFLEVAYGVRTSDGTLHRSKSGRVNDWRFFRSLKADLEGFVSRDDYFVALGAMDHATKMSWFTLIDTNRDGRLEYAEFSLGPHHTNSIEAFLQLDVDFSGRLDVDELDALPADRFPVAYFLLPAFDDDHDNELSLEEFQLTPVMNLLASWESAQDADGDGQLNVEEFRFSPGVSLAALSAEYFRRFDINKDRRLSVDEFPFATNRPQPTEIYALYSDGKRTTITIPEFPIVCSPEISPDNKWVAADGWNYGQNNVAAHVLIASLVTNEIRDLGLGCMPNWSPDGRQISFCKYGAGVFIRDVDPNGAQETCIDPRGWSIQFSPDGLYLAYLSGRNIVIHDVKTGAKRKLFSQQNLPYNYIEHNLTWSKDSKRICFRGHRANAAIDIAIVSTTGDDPDLRIRCDGKHALPDFAWHPDGKRLMLPMQLPGRICQIYQVDPDGMEAPVHFRGQPKHRNNGGLCWSRDGEIFVFVSTR